MTMQQFNEAMHSMWNQNISESIACKNGSFQHPCPDQIKFGILLAQRHGGSNWIISELYKYKQLIVKNELLLDWENHRCSKYSKYIESTNCNEISLVNALNEIYSNYLSKHTSYCWKANSSRNRFNEYYFFWKIQIGQIPPYLFKTLIDYIYCHNIMVLHVIREASVASFWSIQAQTIERIYTMNPDKILRLSHHGIQRLEKDEHINSLELDPYSTLKYVHNVDVNRKMLSKLIKVYPGYIKYQQYDYEDLIGPYSDRYWSSILNWIGGPKLMQRKRKSKHKNRSREHPMACFTKISNWNQIKQILKGTDSYFACEKYHS